jgi:hypothetical protein
MLISSDFNALMSDGISVAGISGGYQWGVQVYQWDISGYIYLRAGCQVVAGTYFGSKQSERNRKGS